MPNVERCMTNGIEWAVREISKALGAAYAQPRDRLRVLINIAGAIAPTPAGLAPADPVRWAFDEEAMRLGHEHGLCSRCARPLVRVGDESFCMEHDARLLAMRLRKEAV